MNNLDVLIRIHNDKMWIHYKNEWVPLNTNLMTGYCFSLKNIITLKIIELKDYSKR